MADYLVTDTELTSVADAIRTKGGTSAALEFPTGFVTAIGNISGGGGITPTGTKNITISSAGTTTEDVTTYASAAITVAAGTAGTPSATKSISGHTATITPSVTNTTGYINGGTKTGTAKTVAASELVSGTKSISQNGTSDVTNYKYVDVNVSGGGGGSTVRVDISSAPIYTIKAGAEATVSYGNYVDAPSGSMFVIYCWGQPYATGTVTLDQIEYTTSGDYIMAVYPGSSGGTIYE